MVLLRDYLGFHPDGLSNAKTTWFFAKARDRKIKRNKTKNVCDIKKLSVAEVLAGFESRHLSKIQNCRHKQRSGQHTLAHQKNIQKKVLANPPADSTDSLHSAEEAQAILENCCA